uniref:Putative ribonuclease H-like domain-containing protein n=1 Tax=Tanacetum cinerariifolium TaxID=118510 RepID=A0A6L2MV94_TANCI|nr:putative ribonuclease H-like domain-containing protein [Tanacetum cinerariifolium]
MNRLVKGNLVRGLPPKLFKNDHTCVACCKGKQHKAFYKDINAVSSISEPLQLLHMDLFGPTSIRSIDHKYYCLVITDDYSRFCWVFFLEHKDETYPILKDIIHLVENQLNKKVKAIRCDNGTEFKNAYIIKLCGSKGIKREYSNARTPQQNKAAERKNKTLIESIGYIVGYSVSNKAYKVYNVPNKTVEETMNLRYLEEKPNVQCLGHEWYFNLDYLTDTLGYKHDKANQYAGTQEAITNSAGTQDADSDSDYDEQVIIVHSYPSHSIQGTKPKDTSGDEVDDSPLNSADEIFQKELKRASAKTVPPGSIPVPTGSILVPFGDTMVSTDDVPCHTSSPTDSFFDDEPTKRFPYPSDLGNHDPSPGIFSSSSYDDEFGATLNNVASTVEVSPVATKRINTIHPQSLIIGDHTSSVQTRSKMDVKSAFLYERIDEEAWCNEFEALIKGEFQMSAMGELTFFLGLQVQQRPDGIFINQDKYVKEILKFFDFGSVWTATTPYEAPKPKSENESDSLVNVHLYRSMIDLEAVKKIFKYLKGQPKLGLWYPRESPFVLKAYSDSDYAGENKDRKSITGGCTLDTKSVVRLWPHGLRGWISGFLSALHGLGKQFWSTATLRSPELGPPAIQATIDKTPYTINEDLNKFSPQWRFLVHTILHCLSTKSGSWDQFGSLLAVALICLSDGRQFNWSSYIFKGMVSNIGNAKEFLMYPKFLQAILGIETRIKRQYKVLKFSSKLFANMRLNFEGHPMPLLAAMLSQDQKGEVFEQGQSSNLNIASFSRTHETDANHFTNVEDEHLGGSFHTSPPRSTQAPPAGQTSGSAEDLITLTAFSSVVSILVQKVNTLETKLKDHKKLFKDVVGKLVKKVKAMEQDVDLDALLALANAAVTVDFNISPGGKTIMVEEDITVKERTFKQMQEDRLGEQAAKRRQQEVLASAMYYTEADWINIMAQVEANTSLSKTLLGDDVSEDNFPARMAALIKRKKQALKLATKMKDMPMTQGQQRTYMRQFVKNQSCAVYSTGWSMAYVKSFTDDQLKAEFKKIQKVLLNIQIQASSMTLKRTGPVLEEPSSKRQKSTESPIPYVPQVPQSPVVSSPKSFGTRRKSLGRNREILHMVDKQDLLKLYGLVVKYYENHPLAGAGLILWGDL